MLTPAMLLNSSPVICGLVPAPDEAKEYLPGLAFSERDQLGHRVGREVDARHQHVRHLPQDGDAGEVLAGVERQLGVERRRDGVRGDGVEADRVAVRRGTWRSPRRRPRRPNRSCCR
jgi:hypothetical protein